MKFVKLLFLAVLAGVAATVIASADEIERYRKISAM
ncbi:hypothetical protein EV378_6327 [Pseudonocardia endophytica]|uniref:Uncharacterized protein n=1 Tax=Pseudonocardia endophytica TaxID=401976 RepID=A0A4V2PHW3_PSEEN|nr:hypothetical protein EV378_6327 [Pseudonocardia endophytica]